MSKNFRKKIKFHDKYNGIEVRQNWIDQIAGYSGYLPDSLNVSDIDAAFIDMVKNELSPVAPQTRNGVVINERIPVVFMTTQGWSDYSKTWEFKDNNKDLTYPFIVITKDTDLKPGTIQNGYYNIPGRRNWVYLKVPNNENGREGVDLYKIPQPTAVDINYNVKLFSSRIDTINLFNESVFKQYNSYQKHLIVKGHSMPSKNEGGSDESQIEIEEKVVLINSFEIIVQGYLVDPEDFEFVRSIDRTSTSIKIDKTKNIRK